jgi:hypothetical protein
MPADHCPVCFHRPHELRVCPSVVWSSGAPSPDPVHCECANAPAMEARIRALEASTPSVAQTAERHKPGDFHDYTMECRVCGERGFVNLSVVPWCSDPEHPNDPHVHEREPDTVAGRAQRVEALRERWRQTLETLKAEAADDPESRALRMSVTLRANLLAELDRALS